MTRLRWIALPLFLVPPASIPCARAQATAPLGMVLSSDGKGTLERAGARKPLLLGELLYEGDRLAAAASKVTILYCPTARRVEVAPRGLVEIGASALAVRRGPPPVEAAGRCLLPRVALGSESLERIGGLRARGSPPIAIYLGGAVSTPRPTFSWAPVEGAVRYRVVLRTESGAEVLSTETRETKLDLPASAAALADGAYDWEVSAHNDGTTLARQAVSLTVKRDGVPEAGSDPAERLARAVALENAAYYAEAAAYYRELRGNAPEDARLTRHLAWLYWQAGLISAANVEIERLSGSHR